MKGKRIALLFALACLAYAMSSCTTTVSPDGTKTTVPDKEFVNSMASVAATAAKQAIDAYTKTHQPEHTVQATK